jgi:hypothetical protein
MYARQCRPFDPRGSSWLYARPRFTDRHVIPIRYAELWGSRQLHRLKSGDAAITPWRHPQNKSSFNTRCPVWMFLVVRTSL